MGRKFARTKVRKMLWQVRYLILLMTTKGPPISLRRNAKTVLGGEDSEFFGFELSYAPPAESIPFASPWPGPATPSANQGGRAPVLQSRRPRLPEWKSRSLSGAPVREGWILGPPEDATPPKKVARIIFWCSFPFNARWKGRKQAKSRQKALKWPLWVVFCCQFFYCT